MKYSNIWHCESIPTFETSFFIYQILLCFFQVNSFGNVVYDEYVRAVERIVDYRTHIGGIRPKHMNKGRDITMLFVCGSMIFSQCRGW